LILLHESRVIHYIPVTDKPQIVFLTPRQDAAVLKLNKSLIEQRKEDDKVRMDSILNYCTNNLRCRSQMLLEYFNELTDNQCGICDYCINKKAEAKKTQLYQTIRDELIELSKSNQELNQLINKAKSGSVKIRKEILRELMDSGKIKNIH